MIKRRARVTWIGNLKEGSGTVMTESGALSGVPYYYGSRFENQRGTNPEELIAAAHAPCFSMALTAELEKMRLNAESIETHAEVTLEQDSGVSTITAVLLRVSARIPGASQDQFNEAVSQARHCPVSRLLNAPISLDAKLVDNTAPRLRKVG